MKPIEVLSLYVKCLRIRRFEERIAAEYQFGEMRCPIHLSVGQELLPSLLSFLLKNKDVVFSTHRSHAHYLAKGGNPKTFIAELYGKLTGCSAGRGGSMHLVDLEVNFYGSTAIVGNSIPVGVGVALASSLKKIERVTVVYLGDAAIEEGAFYESANFAATKKLPVIFICENNGFSVYSSLEARQPKNRKITDLSSGLGLVTYDLNLLRIDDSYHKLSEAIQMCRNNSMPILVEAKVFRTLEHCGPNNDDKLGYRTNDEINEGKASDPLLILEELIRDNFEVSKAFFEIVEREVGMEVENSFEFAKNSPYPKSRDWMNATYAIR